MIVIQSNLGGWSKFIMSGRPPEAFLAGITLENWLNSMLITDFEM